MSRAVYKNVRLGGLDSVPRDPHALAGLIVYENGL